MYPLRKRTTVVAASAHIGASRSNSAAGSIAAVGICVACIAACIACVAVVTVADAEIPAAVQIRTVVVGGNIFHAAVRIVAVVVVGSLDTVLLRIVPIVSVVVLKFISCVAGILILVPIIIATAINFTVVPVGIAGLGILVISSEFAPVVMAFVSVVIRHAFVEVRPWISSVVSPSVMFAVVFWRIETFAVSVVISVSPFAVTFAHAAVGAECHALVWIVSRTFSPTNAAINAIDCGAAEIEEAAVVKIIGGHDTNSRAPNQRTIEIRNVYVSVELPVKQNITEVLIAVTPVLSVYVACVVYVQKVVEVYFISLVILFWSKVQFIRHLVGEIPCTVARFFKTESRCA